MEIKDYPEDYIGNDLEGKTFNELSDMLLDLESQKNALLRSVVLFSAVINPQNNSGKLVDTAEEMQIKIQKITKKINKIESLMLEKMEQR